MCERACMRACACEVCVRACDVCVGGCDSPERNIVQKMDVDSFESVRNCFCGEAAFVSL